MWRGLEVARRGRLRPIWRLGPLIGLLHLLSPMARAWGRLRFRWPYASAGTTSSSVAAPERRTGSLLDGRSGGEGQERLPRGTARPAAHSPPASEDALGVGGSRRNLRFGPVLAGPDGVLRSVGDILPQPRLHVTVRPSDLSRPGSVSCFSGGRARGRWGMSAILAVLLLERWHFVRKISRVLTEDSE